MQQSPLRLIRSCEEFIASEEIDALPRGLRGIYVLYLKKGKNRYNVVYVGMARAGRRGGIRGRLRSHRQKKQGLWSHCSVYEVWSNIRDEEVIELEGLFRHIYKYDDSASKLNTQRSFKLIKKLPPIL